MKKLAALLALFSSYALAVSYSSYPFGDYHWQSPVDTVSALPAIGAVGEARITLDTFTAYVWTGSAWQALSGGGGAVWGSITGTLSNQTDLQNALNLKADLASPAFTGVPTAPTASIGTSTTQLATTAFVNSQGFISATGSQPNVSSTSLVNTTSATTSFVTALTASLTVTASSAPILAKCVLDMTSATAASVANMRVTVNAVAGGTVSESITTATTQHLTVPNQYLSASLGPGTYTVTCDFARASGTGTVTVGQGSLTAVALQGTNSNGITQLTGALQAGPGSGAQTLTGVLPVANGGTHLSSTTINQILYSIANNTIAGLTTANTGALVTSSTGVPSITSGATANRLLRTNGTTVSFAQAGLTTDVTGILPGANGGTGTTMFASGRIPFSNGTTYAADPLFIYNTATNQFTVGNGAGTGKISSVVLTTDPSPNLIAGNFFSRTTGNVAVEIQNENTLPTLDMTNSGGSGGATILTEASRGTLVARTQSQAGDTLLTIESHGRGAAAYSAGLASEINVIATETVTDTTNGADMTFSTTPNGGAAPLEHIRIKQSGETTLVNSHLKSTQTGAVTATVNANAGTGATCSVSNATDVAGSIALTTTNVASLAGEQCAINFATAYGVAPICFLTPANANAANIGGQQHEVYVSSTTAKLSLNFGIRENAGASYAWSYSCIETQ